MKIYNEIITRFNDLTGKWETISEDSYDYDGPIALAQGVPPNSIPVAAADTIADTLKTTTGYFTNGDGTIAGSEIFTGSLSDANEKYYFNVNQLVDDGTAPNSETQFSVTFAHRQGSGSDSYGDTTNNPATLMSETKTIYRQLSQLLLDPLEVSGGFKIASQGSYIGPQHKIGGDGVAGSGVYTRYSTTADSVDEYVYALVGKRSRFKDRMNKKSWTLTLSGSIHTGSGVYVTLTDDSKYVAPVATPAGPRYNIVSGALGEPTGSTSALKADAYKDRTFGWFYPERGIMLFSGTQLSASIPGGQTISPSAIESSTPLLTNMTMSKGTSVISGSTRAGSAVTDITGSIGTHYLHASHSAENFTAGTVNDVYQSSSLYLLWTTGSAGSATHEQYMGVCKVVGVNSEKQIISCSHAFDLGEQPGAGGGVSYNVNLYLYEKTDQLTSSFDTSTVGGGGSTPKFNDGRSYMLKSEASVTASLTGSIRARTSGFAPNLHAKGNAKNALRFVNCMRNVGGTALRLRSEEDATEENYFCRIGASDFNFTSNPTFVSGSKNKMKNTDMFGNPTTFITGVGLYNSSGQLLAIAELSKPLKKTFASEATIKVKLTY